MKYVNKPKVKVSFCRAIHLFFQKTGKILSSEYSSRNQIQLAFFDLSKIVKAELSSLARHIKKSGIKNHIWNHF